MEKARVCNEGHTRVSLGEEPGKNSGRVWVGWGVGRYLVDTYVVDVLDTYVLVRAAAAAL